MLSTLKSSKETERNVMELKELSSILDKLNTTLPNVVTPYRMSKIVNESLKTHLPPQMFYNYVKNGYISSSTLNIGGKPVIQVKKSEVLRWIEKYSIQNIMTSR